MSRFQESTSLAKACEKRGCVVTMTKRNHWKVKTPSGQIVMLAGTASDHRNMRNALSQLRKAGVKL